MNRSSPRKRGPRARSKKLDFRLRGNERKRLLTPVDAAAAPAPLPHHLADGAGDARRFGRHWNDAWCPVLPRDVQHQLGADRVLELLALADRHDEGAGPADHAILVVHVEILDIDRIRLRLL